MTREALRTRRRSVSCFVLGCVLLSVAAAAQTASPDDADDHDSKTEINKDLTNPVTRTWSLKTKNVFKFLDAGGGSERTEYQLKFQPTLPVILTPDWTLITRPEFTLVEDKPYTNSEGDKLRTTGVGDTVLDLVLSPQNPHWLFGVGPTFIFPTANLDRTGQGKWQIGPGGVVGYLSDRWLLGIIAQQWWSFAGAADRAPASQLHLQYLGSWFLSHGWSIGTSPTITFDWNASAGNEVTFPLGLSVSRVIRVAGELPVKLEIQGLYAPIRPEPYGEKFSLELFVIPQLPRLIPDPLFPG